MSLFQPTYSVKLSDGAKETRTSDVWWYSFEFLGKRYRKSTHTRNERTAKQIEAAERMRLARREGNLPDLQAAPTLAKFVPRFTKAIETLRADKPATISFYKAKLKGLLSYKPLADCRLDEIDESMIQAFKEHRTRQEATGRNGVLSVASVNR